MKTEPLEDYKRRVAQYLRQHEAGMSRGQMDRLAALELVSDEDLLRKWSWRSALSGVLFSFAGLPLLINVLRMILPFELVQFLWALDKVSMLLTMAMFAVAAYFTFRRDAP